MSSTTHLSPALWQGISCEWLWVYHSTAPRVDEWSQQITVPPGVFFVESGHVQIRAGGGEIQVPPGHAFFSAPGLRQQRFAPATRLLSVGLRCQWPDGQPLYKLGLNLALPTRRITPLHTATQALFKTVHGRRQNVSYAEGTAMQNRSLTEWSKHEAGFRQWFAEYITTLERLEISPTLRQGSGDRRLEQLRGWLQGWPLDRVLDLREIAASVNLSTRHIHQLLRDDLGMTAQAHQERRRLDHARQRLVQEDTALKEIAFALGFRHPPHFTAWFRRHAGMTPTAYRAGYGVEGA